MLPQDRTIFDQFVLLWVVIEPVNVVSVFLAVAGEIAPKIRLAVAVKAIVVAAVVLPSSSSRVSSSSKHSASASSRSSSPVESSSS